MKEIAINECQMISGANVSTQSIDYVPGPDGKRVPRWTIDGDLGQTLVEGAIMAGYLIKKFWPIEKQNQ